MAPKRAARMFDEGETLLEGRWTVRGVYRDFVVGHDRRGFPYRRIFLTDLQIVKKTLDFGEQWLSRTKGFADLTVLDPGTVVEFTARIERKSKHELQVRRTGKEQLSNLYRLVNPRHVRNVPASSTTEGTVLVGSAEVTAQKEGLVAEAHVNLGVEVPQPTGPHAKTERQ